MTSILLNGRNILLSDIKRGRVKSMSENEGYVLSFIQEWLNNKSTFTVNTSGSTGKPKAIHIPREKMIVSAKKTIEFLHLNKNDTALLCLSANTIAGKMMIVRSIIAELNLTIIDPSGNPFDSVNDSYDFTALVPLQVQNSLDNDHFKATKNIIIGGAPLDESLRISLCKGNNSLFQSYGMTETVSHIALKKITDDYYTGMPGVQLSIDDEGCLIIDAPMAIKTPLITNDVVELINNHQFIWKGRRDFVINSGGVKIHPEQLEQQVTTIIKRLKEVIIYSIPNNEFGESVALLIKGEAITPDEKDLLKSELQRYHYPKLFTNLNEFKYKESGKLDRKATLLSLKH